MKATVYCNNPEHGVLAFYLVNNGEEYFLFNQNYHGGLEDFFKNGVMLDKAMDHSRNHRNAYVEKVVTKLPPYIKYIEKEYDISVLTNTKNSRRVRS